MLARIISRGFLNIRSTAFRFFATNVDSELIINSLQGDDSGIIVMGLNRPVAKNSLNKTLVASMYDALEAVKFDKDARVLIIRSLVPGVFCAGADLKERLTLSEIEVKLYVSRLRNLMTQIENLPIPVITALDGAALGGGLEMALASDVRVASDSTKLGLVETKLAIIPGAGGTQRLPRLIGIAMAKELIFTGRIINGIEAAEIGLVNYCEPCNSNDDAAYQKALSLAREIIPNGPIGVKMAKLAINKGVEIDVHSGCSIEELCYAQVVPTEDRIEGLKAFKERRKPFYIGK